MNIFTISISVPVCSEKCKNSSIDLISFTELCRPQNGLATGSCNYKYSTR